MAVLGTDYEAVAVSQSGQTMGPNGRLGDLLTRLIITVTTAATGTVSIADGNGAAIPITVANTPIGVYTVEFGEGLRAQVATTPGWKVTTGAGATALAVGRFT